MRKWFADGGVGVKLVVVASYLHFRSAADALSGLRLSWCGVRCNILLLCCWTLP